MQIKFSVILLIQVLMSVWCLALPHFWRRQEAAHWLVHRNSWLRENWNHLYDTNHWPTSWQAKYAIAWGSLDLVWAHRRGSWTTISFPWTMRPGGAIRTTPARTLGRTADQSSHFTGETWDENSWKFMKSRTWGDWLWRMELHGILYGKWHGIVTLWIAGC